MTETLTALWVKDEFQTIRGQKVPVQVFAVNQTDIYRQLHDALNVFKLSPQSLGWTFECFTVYHGNSDIRIDGSGFNRLTVNLAENEVIIKFYGEAVAMLQGFLSNFFASVFPDQRLEFEALTESDKAEKVKQEQLAKQALREAAEKERKELAEQRRIKKLLDELTPQDHKILALRKDGASLWSIAKELGVSVGCVRYALQKMSTIPPLLADWEKGRPLSREEWLKAL